MELLIPHECQRCGVVDEAKFTLAGPHLKQVCNNCSSYVKFYSKNHLPDSGEVRLRIWAITQDVAAIQGYKQAIGFIENAELLTPLERRLQWWRLYLHLRAQSGKVEAGKEDVCK